MSKYIDADKLIAEIERRKIEHRKSLKKDITLISEAMLKGSLGAYESIERFITSLQQEPEDKQIIIITESHGDANIKWDCRSLSDVIILLKSAESFITEKQIEKIAGPGSGPDYATTEGRYSHLFKHKQEQPEVDLEKLGEIARHLIAVKDHEEDMRLSEDEWLLLNRIGYPERFNARKKE